MPEKVIELRFGDSSAIAAVRRKPPTKSIDKMHAAHGAAPGHRCGECAELVAKRYDKVYWKCRLYGDSNGPGTDFRKCWSACGKFRERGSGREEYP